MNLHTFEERWRRNHPDDCYLPPFIGGPNDEIFLSGLRLEKIKVPRPKLCLTRSLPMLPKNDDSTAGSDLEPFPKLRKRRASRFGSNRLLTVVGRWIRVGNVPDHLYHIIYYFFTRMGTLETMRAYSDKTFYVLYKNPRDTLRALTFHRRRLIFLNDLVYLNCQLVKRSELKRIYRKRTNSIYIADPDYSLDDDNDDDDDEEVVEFNYELNCRNSLSDIDLSAIQINYNPFVMHLDERRKLNDETNVMKALEQWYSDKWDSGYFNEYGRYVEVWHIRLPTINQMKRWLRSFYTWIKLHMDTFLKYLRSEINLFN